MRRSSYKVYLLVILLLGGLPATRADVFESGSVLKARSVLPAELRRGEHFRVSRRVRNDGFLNTYSIQSDFGDFDAYSTHMLRVRVNEINALGQLSKLSRTEVFATAAIEAGLSPITAIIDFSTRPISSILGLPGGIARMFNRYARRTEKNLQRVGQAFAPREDDSNEGSSGSGMNGQVTSFTEDFFGVGDAERRWHQKLGTNPYTSNDTLVAAIRSVSWADGLGRFALSRASMSSVPGADVVGRVNQLVWSLDAYELQERNRKVLTALGFDPMLIELVLTSPNLAPNVQTTLIAAIEQLKGVENLGELLALALLVEDEPQAHVLIESILMLVEIHQETPLKKLVPMAPVPTAVTGDQTCVATIALDHLAWTRSSAILMNLLDDSAEQHARRQLVLAGTATQMAVDRLDSKGWRVLVLKP